MKDEKKGGWPVVLMVMVLFATPVAVGSALFFSGWRPAAPAVHGTLVQPPRPVAGDFRGHWTLLYFGRGDCPPGCRAGLGKMRQVHLALGRERGRVRRVFAAQGTTLAGTTEELYRSFPGLVLATAGGMEAWARDGGIYLIDPLGNLVLAYGAEADPGGMRRDLSRLLAYSWAG